MKVISVNIGVPKTVAWRHKTVTTGIFKKPVSKPIFLGLEDVVGDNVIDRKFHGGVNKALYAYGFNHYAHWQALYPNLEFTYGMFGENLTVAILDETQIHLGDVFKLGTATIAVAGPREPCYKLGIRFNDSKIIKQFWNSTKCGVYFKVLQEGKVAANDIFIPVEKHPENLSIAAVYNRAQNQN
jgi:MOSC domain-containing protein YiiM